MKLPSTTDATIITNERNDVGSSKKQNITEANGKNNGLAEMSATEQVPGRSVPKFFTSNGGTVQIEVPDFDKIFDKIQSVSPLARLAMMKTQKGWQENHEKGLNAAQCLKTNQEETLSLSLRWKSLYQAPHLKKGKK